MPGKPPGPGGPGPTSPALSGRLSIMQRGRLGQLDDNCRRGQGLGQPGRVAVPGRAGRPPAALGRPRARPAPVDLEQHEGLPRQRAAAGCSCARTCRPRSGRSCEQRACRRGSFLTHCVGVSSWEKNLSVEDLWTGLYWHGICLKMERLGTTHGDRRSQTTRDIGPQNRSGVLWQHIRLSQVNSHA